MKLPARTGSRRKWTPNLKMLFHIWIQKSNLIRTLIYISINQ
jgi:hypothetical protein